MAVEPLSPTGALAKIMHARAAGRDVGIVVHTEEDSRMLKRVAREMGGDVRVTIRPLGKTEMAG